MARKFTTEEVQTLFRERGVDPTFTKYERAGDKLGFLCRGVEGEGCGKPGSISFLNFYYPAQKGKTPQIPRCPECVAKFMKAFGKSRGAKTLSHASKYNLEVVQTLIRDRGAEPLFDAYASRDQPLLCRCLGKGGTCDRTVTVTVDNLVEYARKDESYVILCRSCSHAGYRPAARRENAKPPETLESIQTRLPGMFSRWGATILEDYPGRQNVPIRFLCECGVNEHRVSWAALCDGVSARCPACHEKHRPRGEAHGSYNPNLTDEQRVNSNYGRGEPFLQWQRAVFAVSAKKAGGSYPVCAVTGRTSAEESLSAHHLYAWALFPDMRFDVANGAPICRSLHVEEFHRLYGECCTYADFAAYVREKTGRDFDQPDPLAKCSSSQALMDWNEFLSGLRGSGEGLRNCVPELVLGPAEGMLARKRAYAERGQFWLPFFLPEFLNKRELVRSMIDHRAGRSGQVVGARELEVREIPFRDGAAFIQQNHLQGAAKMSKTLALTLGDEVMAVMGFGVLRTPNSEWRGSQELVRLAIKSGWRVPGAAQRLFQAFVTRYTPERVVSYLDRRLATWDTGQSVYSKLGFKLHHCTQPSYLYTLDGRQLLNKKNFQHSQLRRKLGERRYDPSASESENMRRAGFQKLADCGVAVFEWTRK